MTEMKLIVYISVQVHVHLNYVTCEIKNLDVSRNLPF